MTRVLLYWNHICVLHNYEKRFLEELTAKLKKEDIELKVRYFGLGYPEHMSDYLRREDAVLPDMMVSADLEVYEDARIYETFEESLYPAAGWMNFHRGEAFESVWRGEKLVPFVAIPLVYYTSNPEVCRDKAVDEIEALSFGGVNNSAGKTLFKTVWSHYGRERAEAFLQKCSITDMPIGAFRQVQTGQQNTALVPSIYAMRADGISRHMCIPKEGPILIPSFLCARKSIPEWAARRVTELLLDRKLCEFYETNGNLIVYPEHAPKKTWEEMKRFFTPSKDWFHQVAPEEFYEPYMRLVPGAKIF